MHALDPETARIVGLPTGNDERKEDEIEPALRFGFRLVCSTALYPLEYAKTLIQVRGARRTVANPPPLTS